MNHFDMIRFNLTLLWVVFFALLIIPIRTMVHYEQRIADLREENAWLTARFLDCVDAGNGQRMYFGNSADYVDFHCTIYLDNTRPRKDTSWRKPKQRK